jgi:hypothetical protein
MIRLLGFGAFAVGAAFGIGAWYLDRQLQAFRLPGKPASAYWLVPVRIRRELYRPEAGDLVDRTWRFIAAMYGLAILGMILIAAGS